MCFSVIFILRIDKDAPKLCKPLICFQRTKLLTKHKLNKKLEKIASFLLTESKILFFETSLTFLKYMELAC